MSMPGFTAEVSLDKTSEYYPLKIVNRTEEVIHPSWIYKGFSPSRFCSERYEECLANSIDSLDACLCQNGYSSCRRGYGLPAPPLSKCFPAY
jgi:hypothetical protein